MEFISHARKNLDKKKLLEFLEHITDYQQEHPNDTHPPFGERMKNLNVKFDEMTNKDAEGVAQYFSGKTTVNNNDTTTHKDGIFEKLYDNLSSLTSYNGTLTTISDGLSRDGTKLEDSRVKALDLLNSRYDSMTSRFIEYDAMISRTNNSFSALQQQIEMSVNGNN